MNGEFLSYTFTSILSYIYMCPSGAVFRIRNRIHKAPEYGSGPTKLGHYQDS